MKLAWILRLLAVRPRRPARYPQIYSDQVERMLRGAGLSPFAAEDLQLEPRQ